MPHRCVLVARKWRIVRPRPETVHLGSSNSISKLTRTRQYACLYTTVQHPDGSLTAPRAGLDLATYPAEPQQFFPLSACRSLVDRQRHQTSVKALRLSPTVREGTVQPSRSDVMGDSCRPNLPYWRILQLQQMRKQTTHRCACISTARTPLRYLVRSTRAVADTVPS